MLSKRRYLREVSQFLSIHASACVLCPLSTEQRRRAPVWKAVKIYLKMKLPYAEDVSSTVTTIMQEDALCAVSTFMPI